jgi:hypothetical protein
MATYDDYHGVYFTIQHTRLMFPDLMEHVQFVVIDNNPDSEHGQATAKFMEEHVSENGKYVPFTEYKSPAVKTKVFDNADGDFVLCIDCHVLLPQFSLHKLCAWFKQHDTENVLVQGPLWYNELNGAISTHFDPVWRGEMWGIWGTDPRGLSVDDEPFEIPMQGMGLFAMKKEFWPGFNPLWRGFGAEEGYIHEKVRQRGGKCLCLPFLRWVHRFERPGGAPYLVTTEDRIRNYLLGHIELGLPIDPILDHFKDRQSPHKIMLGAKAALLELIRDRLVPPETKIRMLKAYEPAVSRTIVNPRAAVSGGVPATYM